MALNNAKYTSRPFVYNGTYHPHHLSEKHTSQRRIPLPDSLEAGHVLPCALWLLALWCYTVAAPHWLTTAQQANC
jgi:hypothetical protein